MIKIGLVVNLSTKIEKINLVEIQNKIKALGGESYILTINSNATEKLENFIDLTKLPTDLNVILVFGGDGTIIQAVRQLSVKDIPILGINLGTVGFLAEVEIENIDRTLECIFSSEYILEKRFMIRGDVIKNGEVVYTSDAINDIVVARGGIIRSISTRVEINNKFFNTYFGDGIVVTTPTGSTGYNFSVCGSVFMPEAEVLGITPICPHSLSQKTLIAPATSEISIEVEWNKKSEPIDAIVSFDGNRGLTLKKGDRVIIKKSESLVSFLHLRDFNFFDILNKKFHTRKV